jgi:hypothetical protein
VNYESSLVTSWLRSGLEAVDRMQRWWSVGPQVLTQPILPGWTFAINNVNSSAPQTEVEVVARQSYGRQLGRMSDVLTLLLEGRQDLREKQQVVDFLDMKIDIDTIKAQAAGDRLDQIRADLLTLRNSDPDRYNKLRAALLSALNASS